MSTSKAQKLFCTKLTSFTQDMRVVLRNDTEAAQMLSALDAMVNFSPELVIAFFKTHIAIPYEKKILSRDESFLRSELHSKLEKSVTTGPLENIHHKIHDRWGGMTEKEKTIIWDYFKLLVVLSKRL
jgi:hypothetical protein